MRWEKHLVRRKLAAYPKIRMKELVKTILWVSLCLPALSLAPFTLKARANEADEDFLRHKEKQRLLDEIRLHGQTVQTEKREKWEESQAQAEKSYSRKQQAAAPGTSDESSSAYQEYQKQKNDKKKAQAELEKKYAQERLQKDRSQKKKLSEEEELGLYPAPERIDPDRRAGKLTGRSSGGGSRGRTSGDHYEAPVAPPPPPAPADSFSNRNNDLPPIPPQFVEPEMPPPAGDFEPEEIPPPPPVFDDEGGF